ncbi:DUF1704 domain-containing protein [uncultured Paraglaciecola sp.]|uniref:DUF1704 domain-containing protein n=1 Tax=uncultured Paraglaciecola sp. TaxID=1765024 RepID=UPI002638F131|nr:DUF1704 domain-containing protein [uncultured Paraglaciecola sp.]
MDYLKTDGEFMLLFVGKIGLQHIPFVKELRWRNLLKKSQVTPNYIDSKLFESKMTRLKKSVSILNLIKGKHPMKLGLLVNNVDTEKK